jgi:hypothetical protein
MMSEREHLPQETQPERALESDAARSPALPWAVAPGWQPFWYLGFCWWQAGVGELARAGTASAASAAALVPAGKLAGFLSEATFYWLWWRGGGRRLPYWRFFCVVASASLADVLAIRLAEIAHTASPAFAAWGAALAGLQAWRGDAWGSPALRITFGTLGILTAARIGVTAHAQARALGIRGAVALAWTAVVWALGRIALLWITDLARGRSPLPVP